MHFLERLAEERIRLAQRAGAFANLPGAGKPLVLDDDRLVPEASRAGYRILKSAGIVPPEVEQRKEALTLRKLVAAASDDATRKRALQRLALIETCLEARGTSLAAHPQYRDRIAKRLGRE